MEIYNRYIRRDLNVTPAQTPKGGSIVKLITAVIQPHKLDDVRAALGDIGIQGMTVTEARTTNT